MTDNDKAIHEDEMKSIKGNKEALIRLITYERRLRKAIKVMAFRHLGKEGEARKIMAEIEAESKYTEGTPMIPKTLTIEVTKFTVLQRECGTDYVMLWTTLPAPFPSEVSKDPLHMTFEIRKGHGVKYLCENFGLEPEDINVIETV